MTRFTFLLEDRRDISGEGDFILGRYWRRASR
jgi:hypothetical protein